MLKLSEIFCSIQGESTYAGLPCIFIRLAECNLRCRYCDTTFSYKVKSKRSIDEIISEIECYDPIKLIEITGGEPLLQEEVYQLFTVLQNRNYKILLETNGSVLLQKVPSNIIKIVDVKTPGSNCADSFIIENLGFVDPQKDELKFVLSNRIDYDWARKFINNHKLEVYKILFSAVTEELELKTLAKWIVDDRLSVRMQLQLQKYIWNKNERGV